MKKAKDLRDQSIEELEAHLLDLDKERFHLVNEYQLNKKVEQPHRLRAQRRDKARVLTVLNEKRKNDEASESRQ